MRYSFFKSVKKQTFFNNPRHYSKKSNIITQSIVGFPRPGPIYCEKNVRPCPEVLTFTGFIVTN